MHLYSQDGKWQLAPRQDKHLAVQVEAWGQVSICRWIASMN